MNRREFLMAAGAGMALWTARVQGGTNVGPAKQSGQEQGKTRVSIVRTADRTTGIKKAIDLLGINPVAGKDVLLKPNFNTADPFPGSTHNDTLTHVILQLKAMGAASITIGERSGPPDSSRCGGSDMGEGGSKDGWDKTAVVLHPVGGLLTAATIALLGFVTSNMLNRRQAVETNTWLYSELMSRREESESALRKDMFVSSSTPS